ncbi:protein FAM83H [Corythoichthys intestinalis]|uniref:protein FAM83H n=1 Tax=Corythoichthys intestinalis TaxID=161448 RepID=UPI0025A6724A|nr:protein FAM83H [Corythoichthys intestinalis]XP_057704132.1 protein FAM83H [Corythoichthys intestinalis]XP_057704133.1 protein FAM83H [Corythoichthys intestinalis]XP_057704134.1 protein FAM83H [Corythoichthys intestinalis]XP_057704135.1 protein FAM83H [Corythoichthys intestinalis]
MARRSQCSSAGDNPMHPNYLPPHYREEYRLAIDALIEEELEGYYDFLQKADVVDFLSTQEIQYIQSSVQVPQQSIYQEQPFLDNVGDSSSDTYWPVHSDLDAPGLDLGWPQLHLFGGPTEVTTLVNPPEPEMPSIKEQARRLIKNAQQVIAIVMDMFTDVDIFADILNAAMRNVAVYILLDERNAHHFMNMVSNCRVNLQNMQFLRVRTVSGITYHCRSGKSFKGQMMDRFLLTDCRAVLSGNYSFMWSFEKLHRCMAHLFLGQLVSTFDEEFRILFAQSQPISTDEPVAMEDIGFLQKWQYPSKRTSLVYREPRKFGPMDMPHPEDWAKPSYDEHQETDWRTMHLKRNEPLYGPIDMHSRFPSQQSGLEQLGHSRFPVMENPAFKRQVYSEGIPSRYSYPFPTQPAADLEARGRALHRGQQQNVGPGPDNDYGGPDKFWNQKYPSAEQSSEPGLPQEMEPYDNFDPVLNYLSSTRNVDFEQVSEKLQPPADLSLSQHTMDDKQFLQDRRDPMVKRGLRNWRINSYLSAYDNPGDEGLPLMPPQTSDPFEEPSNPVQTTAPLADSSIPKIPNVREFKIPAVPRVSQLPSYAKAFALETEQANKLPEESTPVLADTKTTETLTPSESSSTTEGEKSEESEQKESNTAVRKDESFKRKYNAAMPRSSRLRSSLIFNSLEQHTAGQQDEESDKTESEQTKLPFASQVFGQRRSGARDSFAWTRYLKSSTFDSSAQEGTNKPEDKDSKSSSENLEIQEPSKSSSENVGIQEPLKLPDVEQGKTSPSPFRLKRSESDLTKADLLPKSLVSNPLPVDMNDPDKRLKFFKELAAKRKAAKAAEAEKKKEKAPMKTPTNRDGVTVVKEDTASSDGTRKDDTTSQMSISLSSSVTTKDSSKTKSSELNVSDEANNQEVSNLTVISQTSKSQQPKVPTDLDKAKLRDSQTAASLSVSAETESLECDSEDPERHKPALSESSSGQEPIVTKETHANLPLLEHRAEENISAVLTSTSTDSTLVPTLNTVDSASSSASNTVISNIQTQDSSQTNVAQPDAKSANSEHLLSISSPQSTSNPSDSPSIEQTASVLVPTPPESSHFRHFANEKSGVFHESTASGSEPNSSALQCTVTDNDQKVSTIVNTSVSTPVVNEPSGSPIVPSSFGNDRGDCETHSLSSLSHESNIFDTQSLSKPDQKDVPTPTIEDLPQDLLRRVNSSSESNPTELVPSVLPSQTEKPEAITTVSLTNGSPSDISKVTTHPTSSTTSVTDEIVPTDKKLDASLASPLASDNLDPRNVDRKDSQSPRENNAADSETTSTVYKQSVCGEGINEQAGQNKSSGVTTEESPQPRQPKTSQSRYHSSTAGVLSSSNLRDDTKLLLEQISANSQSRNESTKESPVTDDEKEDEADKNAKREKEREIGSLSGGLQKSSQDRDKLLERLQSMRKERKVYSRFDMTP